MVEVGNGVEGEVGAKTRTLSSRRLTIKRIEGLRFVLFQEPALDLRRGFRHPTMSF